MVHCYKVKLAVFEILTDFIVLPYIACPRHPYIRVYRLYGTCSPYMHYVEYLCTGNHVCFNVVEGPEDKTLCETRSTYLF